MVRACRGLVGAAGPAFSDPESFVGGESGAVGFRAEGFMLRFGAWLWFGVFEVFSGEFPRIFGELCEGVEVPFNGSSCVVGGHASVSS